jgi:N-acetyl sugar amidotransferase
LHLAPQILMPPMLAHPQSCTRCLMDQTASSVTFDEKGVCNYCRKHDTLLPYYPQEEMLRKERFEALVAEIKKSGRNKRYDCIVGISGGTDSTYTLLAAVRAGLRPLAVFFDNGWSTEISVTNIKNAVEKLKVDLYTYVVNWEEFKALQVAFLKASVPCVEVPTDVAIMGTLYKLARQEGLKYILSGASFMTEGIVPMEWSYIDGKYVKSISKLFSSTPLKTYPGLSLFNVFTNTFIKRIKVIPFTNYFHYTKVEARTELEQELGWRYYGGHHYENVYSHWAFGYYTVKKFGFDKRKVSLSGPLRMGLLQREEALKEILNPPPVASEITEYVLKKLGLSEADFQQILEAPNKSFRDLHQTGHPPEVDDAGGL